MCGRGNGVDPRCRSTGSVIGEGAVETKVEGELELV